MSIHEIILYGAWSLAIIKVLSAAIIQLPSISLARDPLWVRLSAALFAAMLVIGLVLSQSFLTAAAYATAHILYEVSWAKKRRSQLRWPSITFPE